ncbi:hypothetical protein CI109_100389 [Kwoniella shandongensis]|uniref:Uncharacterized protein n=1 Tax=Kwoniella shandongensis TaxID=1734106 RepID=A0A5M6C3V7_9TREE|nr:uncharacterized protein CI109_001768 [Kwoniella shandongensis]KAA5529828.1 hypothetical protein CI109_001768 [Kwoniella shandongensis]
MNITISPTSLDTALATATSTLFDVISTSLSEALPPSNDTSVFDGGLSSPDTDLPAPSEGNYALNTFIGLIIVLIASLLNALGLNLTKLDHVRQQGIPKRQRKKDWMRILWLAGMGTYIASQVFGSPLALRYLRPDWVAPLGSSSLVFNFLFARWLVGTPVTPTDIRGTAVIIVGVILIIVFSSINHGLIQSLDITRLNSLWTRGSWIAYFIFIILFTSFVYLLSNLLAAFLASRASFSPLPSPSLELPTSRPKSPNAIKGFFQKIGRGQKKIESIALRRMESMFQRTDDARLIWLQGIGWAVTGGSLAGLCLVFTKAVVKLFGLAGHPFVHPSGLISLLSVIITAVLQIVCLNRALECADTVVVVPLFYAGYTVFGFVNSLIFYNEAGQYERWVLIAVFLSIAVLISGVVLLSLKSSAKTAPDPYTVSAQPSRSMRLNPRVHKRGASETDPEAAGTSKLYNGDEEDDGAFTDEEVRNQNVVWEVGSVSDASNDDDREEDKGKGVGGVKGGSGERRGLLGDEEEQLHEAEEGEDHQIRDKKDPFGDEEDGDTFGDYEGVEREEVVDVLEGEGLSRKSSR